MRAIGNHRRPELFDGSVRDEEAAIVSADDTAWTNPTEPRHRIGRAATQPDSQLVH
jgi:hypothetical protein